VAIEASTRATPWMQRALELAARAAAEGEVPVGALVLRNGRVLGEGWNRTVGLCDPTAHAEILALRRAAAVVGNHRLDGTTLVTTLEPCVMCLGAILECRVGTLVYGASDSQRGGLRAWEEGAWSAFPSAGLEVIGGVEAVACRARIQRYFRAKRAVSG